MQREQKGKTEGEEDDRRNVEIVMVNDVPSRHHPVGAEKEENASPVDSGSPFSYEPIDSEESPETRPNNPCKRAPTDKQEIETVKQKDKTQCYQENTENKDSRFPI